METDRIRMETDSDICFPDGNRSDMHGIGFGYLEYLFSCFLLVFIHQDGNRSDTNGNGFGYLGYPFPCFLTIPSLLEGILFTHCYQGRCLVRLNDATG